MVVEHTVFVRMLKKKTNLREPLEIPKNITKFNTTVPKSSYQIL